MKKILTILMMILSITMFSQEKYPRIEKDSLGQEVVVMTIKQAMSLDNNSDLLKLYEELGVDIYNYDISCIKVVDGQNKLIATLNLEIKNLKEQIDTKDQKIDNLQRQITDYVIKVGVLESEVKNRNDLVTVKDKQIKGLRTKMIIGGVGATIVIGGLIFGLLAN